MAEQPNKFKKPSPLEIREFLLKMPGWTVQSGRLEKEFRFLDFARAMIFMNKIVNPIEENQNYPRLLITYNRVHVSLFTNTAGGITVMDLDMAREFDSLAGEPVEPEEDEGMIKA